jgi:hypothetical protein
LYNKKKTYFQVPLYWSDVPRSKFIKVKRVASLTRIKHITYFFVAAGRALHCLSGLPSGVVIRRYFLPTFHESTVLPWARKNIASYIHTVIVKLFTMQCVICRKYPKKMLVVNSRRYLRRCPAKNSQLLNISLFHILLWGTVEILFLTLAQTFYGVLFCLGRVNGDGIFYSKTHCLRQNCQVVLQWPGLYLQYPTVFVNKGRFLYRKTKQVGLWPKG